MPETTTTEAASVADPWEAAMDAAATELTGLTMLQGADRAWSSLMALTAGSQVPDVEHHRGIVTLACNVKPVRDHLIVESVDHPDLSLACVRELVWLTAKAPQPLQPMVAGAAAMLLLAVTGSTVAAGHHARVGADDTLSQLVAQLIEAGIPTEDVKSMLLQAKPAVRKVLEDLSQPITVSS